MGVLTLSELLDTLKIPLNGYQKFIILQTPLHKNIYISMEKQKTSQTIDQLRQQIRKADQQYYILNQPQISDQKYDQLFNQLKNLEKKYPDLITPDSPTQRVSGKPLEAFNSITHSIPMLSIDNTYNQKELKAFDQRVRKALETDTVKYVVEHKIDGVAVSLQYQNGSLAAAATRGNGITGDDITQNVKTIKEIPLKLDSESPPENLEVRGEIYLSKENFAKLNEQKQLNAQPLFANPRNAAAGSLKLLDPSITAQRPLSFFAYSIGLATKPLAKNHYETLLKLKKMALPINKHTQLVENIDQALEKCQSWQDKKTNLPYQIDGLVIKVNNLDYQDILGATGRAPRWCIAYKFPAQQEKTTIESIETNVGKTGILTPVANLKPVQLSGTTVKRASLHNFDELKRLDVAPGDTVLVEKAGEIIPQIVKVVQKKQSSRKPVTPPEKCPVCSSKAKKEGAYLICKNKKCPAVNREKILHFVGKAQMDIEHLGPALIDQLLKNKLVTDIPDIYKLKFHQLTQLNRMADKSAEKVLQAIDKSKNKTLTRFINALGIPHVGLQSAQILAENFNSIEKLKNADLKSLEQIDQIGPAMAKSIYEYFHNEENIEKIDQMLQLGVKPSTKKKKSSKLENKTFVITGTLPNLKRDQAKNIIKQHRGKVASSISKKTSYLLAGENPGSKLDKAKDLGITVINENQLLEMIE